MIQRIALSPDYQDEYVGIHAKFLHIALWYSFFISVYFASINSGFTGLSFWALAVASLAGLVLNYFQKYTLAVYIPVILGMTALFINFYEGISLFDPGVVALPLLIILSSFLLGSRMIYRVAVVILVGMILLVYFERTGSISPPSPTSNERLIIISVLIVFAAVLQKRIISDWERIAEAHRQAEHQIRETYVRTLEGWAKTLEFHDRETLGHSQRVTDLCQRLAEHLGITDPQELEYIRWGAILHDIGKLAIPYRILHKEGELSKEEWGIIKRHPDFALDLLGNINYLKPALTIPGSHHENWDGTGYPQGLKGEQIPLYARIFTVVDNWDALTTDRPYREAWSREQTLHYLRSQSGKKFDPKIVDVFLKMMTSDR
ncbi:MAG TPA: HD-GYP domain-containing protein [Anaerolineales bacterium]|nr:HD-GYP domain-containing protein [Anaerolineales bacterium]